MSTVLALPTFESPTASCASRAVRARPPGTGDHAVVPVRHQALGSAVRSVLSGAGAAHAQELRHLAGEEDRILFYDSTGFAMRRFG